MMVGTSLFPVQDDFFEQIQKDLERPSKHTQKKPPLTEFIHSIARADSYLGYKEIYLSGRNSQELDKTEGRNSLGFLLFGTYAGTEGQLGDLNIQGRATYYSRQFTHGKMMPREYTKKLDALKLELHNAYLRMRVAPPMCNVRVGHFYVPFGIQPWIDTHGTLLQGPAAGFVGFERDWGIAVDGQNDLLEYELGLTRGSGLDYFTRRNNFIVSGKVSTPRVGEHLNEWMGLSYLLGRIYDPMAARRLRGIDVYPKSNVISKWRVGLDAQKYIGPARIRFEISGGRDAAKVDVLGEFFELQYILDKKNILNAYFQLENLTQRKGYTKGSDTTLRLGLTYNISANYNLQFVTSKDIRTTWGRKDTWIGLLLYGQLGFF
jgi:hypothetical protein